MLTSTKILRYIEKKLGYKFNELELDHNDIIENIKEETLPLFSKYFPFQVKHTLNTVTDLVDGESNIFNIDNEYGLEIINVSRLISSGSSSLGYMGEGVTAPMHPVAISCNNDPFMGQFTSDLSSIGRNPTTFRFIYPNKLEILPSTFGNTNIAVMLNCVHPDHFGTIPMNLQEFFLKLALYDTQEALYHIRHRIVNLQTSYGSIELFIDELQSASDKREELIEKFTQSYSKTAHRKKIFIH